MLDFSSQNKREKHNSSSFYQAGLILLFVILVGVLTACGEATSTSTDGNMATYLPKLNPAQIAATNDGGYNWNSVYTYGTNTYTPQFKSINCPVADTCLALVSDGSIIVTNDNGNTWEVRSRLAGMSGDMINCPTADVCFVMDYYSVHSSVDSGRSWKSLSIGTPEGGFKSISCPNATNCFVISWKGLIKATTDSGKTWINQTSQVNDRFFNISCATTVNCIAVGTHEIDRNRDTGAILVTNDSGKTWKLQYPDNLGSVAKISCPSAANCYALGAQVFATVDGGKTWDAQDVTNPGTSISCPSTTICLTSDPRGNIFLTSNGGITWAKQPSGIPRELGDIACPTVKRCFVLVNTY